jgi:hypothetical protein
VRWKALVRGRARPPRSRISALSTGLGKSKKDQPSQETPAAPKKRLAFLQDEFREDLAYWVSTDSRVAMRLLRIMDETLRNPFEGIGKPDPSSTRVRGPAA